ncbi:MULTISPECIES: hypothetical protein [unclassified Amycolatopsis]|uniref:hypothetical protein n=1 Tax=unclassified Amycolatopsis TaxID=2618356 RepID=UPI001C69BA6C|nr:hypothetical protein [Amycolatopsis sp. DSM 110486]QYN20177.1 hypothetical protein K1T34_47850 [Amycolatopsis sp. DSM 110486]
MSEPQDVIESLSGAGVLQGVTWAYLSATSGALDIYSEAEGHDAALLGSMRYTLFRDRLDRVFACERYAVRSGDDDADLDLLFEGLTRRDIDTMPKLDAGLVRRSNLNGSPGWVFEQLRFLLASCDFGKLDSLPWPQKSPTKQRVAGQRDPEPSQPSLFEDAFLEELGGLEVLDEDLDLVTYVVAHSLDPISGNIELVFGRARLNSGGGQAWRWKQDLLGMLPADGGRRTGGTPLPTGPSTVSDAPVRLRRSAEERRNDRDSGAGGL